MGTGLRKAHLRGGPLDGQDGEVVAMPLPDPLTFGDGGGFVYHVAGVKDGVVQYRYDAPATRKRLLDLGVHPDLAAQALDTRTNVGRLLMSGAEVDPGEGTQFDVVVHLMPTGWECHVNGTLVERQPRDAFDAEADRDAIKEWVESVVHALSKEATK